jgi:hypothetical protein
MTSIFDSSIINDLAQFPMIGGTYQELYFYVYSSTGSPIDITSASCSWVMCPYGQPTYPVLTKSGSPVVSGSVTNLFMVVLNTGDTQYLSGKYIHQPIVISIPGYEFRPSQGIISIMPRIG